MRRRAGNYVGGPTISLVERQVRSGIGAVPGGKVVQQFNLSTVPAPAPGIPDPNADIAAAQAAAVANASPDNTTMYLALAALAGGAFLLYRHYKKP